ncbi:site-2 protease family protein [Sneathiella sp.]|uniref:site-2 protease family protein n=1 Tax=Sneathiella sp. TaxID=1964365 RepID=UPI002FDFE7D9
MDFGALLYQISIWIIPALTAITLHEAAHGFVAWRLGDDTAKRLGRVTFNPFRHIDPMGTVIIPAFLLLVKAPFLFGYAKPVPVNVGRLGNPRRDMVWVALAGPGMNFLLAFLFALGVHTLQYMSGEVAMWFAHNFRNGIVLNVILGVFNLLPLPPLDGGRVAVGLLPDRLAIPLARTERYGFLILIGLIFLVPMISGALGHEVNPLSWLLGEPIGFMVNLIAKLAGLG